MCMNDGEVGLEFLAAFWEGEEEVVVSYRGGVSSLEGLSLRIWEEPSTPAFLIESVTLLPPTHAKAYFDHLLGCGLILLRGRFEWGWKRWLDRRLWLECFDPHSLLMPQVLPVRKRRILDHPELFFPGSLWPSYSKERTLFRLWAPTARGARVNLYPDYESREGHRQIDMNRTDHGVWETRVEGDLHGMSYTFGVDVEGRIQETLDPHSLSLTVNSGRSVILDMELTHPKRWESDRPLQGFEQMTDAVVYETHVRDLTMHPGSGIVRKGKFRGLTEIGTQNEHQQATVLDHLIELGITHLHLLPIQDFGSVDERDPNAYNWGYDPECYSVPEGQYATDPSDPVIRVREMKGMVRSLHEQGIGLVMDVVYNHTFRRGDSTFDQIVPGYFYRLNPDGSYSNGSGCGNEIASERPMVRKYIVDSIAHWLEEYHVDGFRMDLLALTDRETARAVEERAHALNPSALIYGEPWTAGASQLEGSNLFFKGAQRDMRMAVFNDRFRDALKGRPDDESIGFASGALYHTTHVLKGLVGSVDFPETDPDFALHPRESINYSACHDNLTLYDKLVKSLPGASMDEIVQRNKLIALILLLSQGVPFLHGGEELLRSKGGHTNSYNAGDGVNQIDWNRKFVYYELFSYYRSLIGIRKQHPIFRLSTQDEVTQRVELLDLFEGGILLQYNGTGIDSWERVLVAINGQAQNQLFSIPPGRWRIVVNGLHAGDDLLGIAQDEGLMVDSISGTIAVWEG